MTSAAAPARRGAALAGAVLAGAAVSVALGVYGREHSPRPHPLFNAGFSSYVQFKVWFTTAAAALVVVQLLTALSMWGHLPGGGPRTALLHRWSGAIAFVLLVPVALNCLYAIGFETNFGSRSLIHSIAGCAFYGGYTAKMVGLRLRGLPGWALPILGGFVFVCFVVLFATSAAWFFQSGRALT